MPNVLLVRTLNVKYMHQLRYSHLRPRPRRLAELIRRNKWCDFKSWDLFARGREYEYDHHSPMLGCEDRPTRSCASERSARVWQECQFAFARRANDAETSPSHGSRCWAEPKLSRCSGGSRQSEPQSRELESPGLPLGFGCWEELRHAGARRQVRLLRCRSRARLQEGR